MSPSLPCTTLPLRPLLERKTSRFEFHTRRARSALSHARHHPPILPPCPPSFLYHLLACHFLFPFLSLLCKSKCSIGLLFLVFFQLLQVSCTAAAWWVIPMRLFHDDDCAFDPAPRALERCRQGAALVPGDVHTRLFCCFACWCPFVCCLALDSYVIPSNNLSLLSELLSTGHSKANMILSNICSWTLLSSLLWGICICIWLRQLKIRAQPEYHTIHTTSIVPSSLPLLLPVLLRRRLRLQL
jgi:hypothetical protein